MKRYEWRTTCSEWSEFSFEEDPVPQPPDNQPGWRIVGFTSP